MNNRTTIVKLVLAAALAAATGCVATVGVPPGPPARVELRGSAPSALHVWLDGHWAWRGGWTWVAGTWALRPHAGAVWVGGHRANGRHGGYWIEGHWR